MTLPPDPNQVVLERVLGLLFSNAALCANHRGTPLVLRANDLTTTLRLKWPALFARYCGSDDGVALGRDFGLQELLEGEVALVPGVDERVGQTAAGQLLPTSVLGIVKGCVCLMRAGSRWLPGFLLGVALDFHFWLLCLLGLSCSLVHRHVGLPWRTQVRAAVLRSGA